MGMPGIRSDYNPNPYIAKQSYKAQDSGIKQKVIRGEKSYDLGPSSIKGGIFGPPDTSAMRGGKQIRFNPASGTYSTERPY